MSKKARSGRLSLSDRSNKSLERVEVIEGTLSCNSTCLWVRDDRGWILNIPDGIDALVGKRVRIILEVLS